MVPVFESRLRQLLEEGLAAGLFSAGAIAARTPTETVPAIAVGTTAFDSPDTVEAGSLFDLASVSKAFVAATVLTLVEEEVLHLDRPVSDWLPVGSGAGSREITLRHLLTHTSGLPADCFAWRDAALTPEQRLDAALSMPLESSPSELFRYSCSNYIAAGRMAEIATGLPLADLVAGRVLDPLGAATITYAAPAGARVVATEVQDYIGRGLVSGEVHDELAWSLTRPVGSAGLFGTADDVLSFATMILNGGVGARGTVLGPLAARLLVNQAVEPGRGALFGHSLGLRISDPGFMGSVAGIGHTGFTGTSFLIDPIRRTAVVLLTNRVHPVRDRVDLSDFRIRVSELVASAAA